MNQDKIFQKNLEWWAKTCPKQAVLLPYVNVKDYVFEKTDQGELNLVKKGKVPFFYHSQEGAQQEAKRWFEALMLRNVSFVCVYGVGLGYYYEAISPWLKKNRKRRVVFLEDDLAVIYRLFETEQGAKILGDRQVQLIYFQDLKEEAIFEAFYWNFAMTRLAVSALHSYYEKKASIFAELRHKVAYDAAMKNALVDEYLRYGVSYYLNFYQNMLCLADSKLGDHFFGKFTKVPAIICGAGPSLAKNIEVLKGLLDHAIIFAGGSALNVLNAAGFQPHFGAGIDPNPMQFERLRSNQGYEVPFFYRNRMYHNAFKMIHGPRLYVTGSGGYDTAAYFEDKFNIRGEFLDEGHNVVNFCVEVANAMGCDPLIFVGMDLGYTGMREYAPGVVEDAKIEQSAILDIEDEDSKAILRKDIDGQPLYTLWKWVAEADWIGDFARNHPSIMMINCTEGGLGFPGINNKTLKDVSKEYLTRSFELKNRIHGETQGSALSNVTYTKIARIMRGLEKSLQHTIDDFQILSDDAQASIQKIKEGKADVIQSGKAALAETELVEEIAYTHVIDVFNETYTRILGAELHEINAGHYSKKQRQLKKLQLTLKRIAFLRDVAFLNKELIIHAFRERKKQKKGVRLDVNIPPQESSQYSFENGRLVISDPQLQIEIDEEFNPLLIPAERRDGQELQEKHYLRVFFNDAWKMCECYVEKNGHLNGQCLLFHSDGSIKEETFYRQGKLHGPATVWGEQNELLAKSWFIEGMQEGLSLWYYPSGALYSRQRYKTNLWHGIQEFYYEDGSLKTLLRYRNGILEGEPILLKVDGTPDRVQ